MRLSKPIIGLCGGIGSGKSFVASEFERLGGLLIGSDRLNHEILRRPEIVREISGWWGSDLLDEDGQLRRDRLADIVFRDKERRERLESLLYPLIATAREAMIRVGIKNSAVKAIILDSPLLLESNLDRLCDVVVFVETERLERLRRVKTSRGWDAQKVQQREALQMPLAKKRARADMVIANNAPADEVRLQIAQVFDQILSETTPTH